MRKKYIESEISELSKPFNSSATEDEFYSEILLSGHDIFNKRQNCRKGKISPFSGNVQI